MSAPTIYRDFQIINGYVQLSPNHEGDRNNFTIEEVLAAIPDSYVVRIGRGAEIGTPTFVQDQRRSERDTAAGFGQQLILRVPGLTIAEIGELVAAG